MDRFAPASRIIVSITRTVEVYCRGVRWVLLTRLTVCCSTASLSRVSPESGEHGVNTPPYRITFTHGVDSWTVSLSGEIDYAASLELTPKLDKVMEHCSGELLFDLGNVTLLDSEGLKVLLTALDRMRRKQGRARVIRCSKSAQRILQLTGLHELLGPECECPQTKDAQSSWPTPDQEPPRQE